MERVIFVEVLDRRGEVVRRERVVDFPLRIGRGYENDLILDDPHVCPAHAVLEHVGEALVLRDLGSVNGLRAEAGDERQPEVVIGADTTVQLGRTQLRFRAPAHPTPRGTPLRRTPRWLAWATSHPLAGLLWLALFVSISVVTLLRSAVSEIDWVSQSALLAGVVLALAAWAGGWALLGRLLGQRPRFVAHFAIVVSAVLLSELQKRVYELGQFLFAAVEPQQLLDMGADSVLLGAVLFAHLSVLHIGRTRQRHLVAALFGVLLLGFRLATFVSDPIDWIATLPYWSRIEPIDPRHLPVESSEAFFAGARALEGELLQLRAEAEAEEAEAEAEDAEEADEPEAARNAESGDVRSVVEL